MALRTHWKSVTLAAILVGEITLLGTLAFWGRSTPADALIVRPGSVAIQVEEQTGPWGQVVIKRAETPGPSWLVVQANRPDGRGPVMGSQRIPAGTSSDVTINLDPKQGAVNSLVVLMLADRGQSGVLEYAGGAASGGGGMMGGGSQSAASDEPAPSVADKQLFADGKPIAVTLGEVTRIGVAGVVHRVVQP